MIKIKVHEGGTMPTINEKGDWIDLHSAEDVELKAPRFNVHTNELEFQQGMISLGVTIAVPKGYEVHVLPRSSTYKNFGIAMSNSKGIIDQSYMGDNDIIRFPFISYKSGKIKKGDRIAQFRIIPSQFSLPKLTLEQVDKMDAEDRGGLGSTGV